MIITRIKELNLELRLQLEMNHMVMVKLDRIIS